MNDKTCHAADTKGLWIISERLPDGRKIRHEFLTQLARDAWALGWCKRNWGVGEGWSKSIPSDWRRAYQMFAPQDLCGELFFLDPAKAEEVDSAQHTSAQEADDDPIDVTVAAYGFEFLHVSDFMAKASDEHLARFNSDCAKYGHLIIWTPDDYADGFMICGNSVAELNKEFRDFWADLYSES